MPMIPVPGLAASSFTYAFTNSDLLGKLIVVVLFGFSVVTWCIMIIKGIGLKSACNDSEAFLNKFRAKRNPLLMADRIEEEPSPAARVCEAAYRRIDQMNILQPDGTRRALRGQHCQDNHGLRYYAISAIQVENVDNLAANNFNNTFME